MSTLQKKPPCSLTQYESAEWTAAFSDFPATEWTLEYRFRGPGTGLIIDAVADGASFTAEITSAQSGALAAGDFIWQAWATNIADDDIVKMVCDGALRIEAGFAPGVTTEVETRSDAAIALATIRVAIAAVIAGKTARYKIASGAGYRELEYLSLTDLRLMEKEYIGRVAKENQRRNGGGPMRQIKTVVYKD